MPYISQEDRQKVRLCFQVEHPEDMTVGNLTYALTLVVKRFIGSRGVSFQSLAEVVAALEQTKDEFQRRMIHSYEDEKLKRNGDV